MVKQKPAPQVIDTRQWDAIMREPRFEKYFTLKWSELLIGNYIGDGATSEVFEAWSIPRQEFVAVKILKLDYPREAYNIIAMREAKVDFKANHLLTIHGMGFTDAVPAKVFIVSELLHSTVGKVNFDDISDREAMRASNDMLHAVRYLHRLGAVYRDWHNGNIFVRKDNTCVLGDLGAMFWSKPVLGLQYISKCNDEYDIKYLPALRRRELLNASSTFRWQYGRKAKNEALFRIYGTKGEYTDLPKEIAVK